MNLHGRKPFRSAFLDRKRAIVVVTDEEWDIDGLKSGFGSGEITRDEVCEHLHEVRAQEAVIEQTQLYRKT